MRKLIDCAVLCTVAIVLAFVPTVFIGYTAAQEGDVGYGHDKWHQGFYAPSKDRTGKDRAAI